MLAINSALLLCEESQTDLNIYWIKNKYLNASFFDLFEPIESHIKVDYIITGSPPLLYQEKELYKPKQRLFNQLVKVLRKQHFQKNIFAYQIKSLMESGFDFKGLVAYERALISSWNRFIPEKIQSRYFKPALKLQNIIDQTTAQFGESTIGVHIRRGDHTHAIRQSPTSLFIEEMKKLISLNDNTLFYLASDSESEKEILLNTFGDRVITLNNQEGDRDSVAGMENALIDLYCLAKTKQILGSFTSTFSLVASELEGAAFKELTV